MAILGRVLEAAGFRVGDPEPARLADRASRGGSSAGRGCSSRISAGNMDSMINHYTANKKVRNDDAYSPGGRIGLRPDRATLRLLPAGPRGVPRRAGDRRRRRGVAAAAGPLRLLERHGPAVDPARLQGRPGRLRHGRSRASSRSPSGWRPARRCATCATCAAWPTRWARRNRTSCKPRGCSPLGFEQVELIPSLRGGARRQARLRRGDADHPHEHQPVQRRDAGAVPRPPGGRANPPAVPAVRRRRWTRSTTCRTRAGRTRATREPIPAFEMIKDSVTIMRGCFGGCTFCSITAHQGRIIQSRSQGVGARRNPSRWRPTRSSRASISDIGGPTANMYQMRCTRPEVEAKCQRLSCVHPDDLQAARHRSRPAHRADAARPATSRASARCSSPAASAWTWPSCRRSTCASWPSTTSAAT